jgi:hypothetical protein
MKPLIACKIGFVVCVCVCVIACKTHTAKQVNASGSDSTHTFNRFAIAHTPHDSMVTKKIDSARMSKILKDTLATKKPYIPKVLVPVMGYRFVVTGNFKGDGKIDTLTEHYFSRVTGKETNKAYDSLEDYDTLVSLTVHKDPYSFVLCNDKTIDTLHIADTPQLLGLSWLHNEGDLDGDGGDELSYVVNWADWSSMNTYHIVSFKNGKWVELFSFMMHDWQLPQLPQMVSGFGILGLDGITTIAHNDSLNKQIEDTLKAFPGMVTKLKNGKIRIASYSSDYSDDSSLVFNLKHPPKTDPNGRWSSFWK